MTISQAGKINNLNGLYGKRGFFWSSSEKAATPEEKIEDVSKIENEPIVENEAVTENSEPQGLFPVNL